MQILTKEKWYLFKEDGKLFELLVEELLHAKYPDANFKHTSWTRDGGKDFEGSFSFFDGKIKTWAECKYHKHSLPIEDVSMTLFMAYVESAHAILFFSYSPVNTEFHKYINLYQNKSNKEIKIYDDLALEELILKNKNKIDFRKFFGDFTTDDVVESNGMTYKYWVHSRNQSKSLHINELVRLEFCAANHSSKEKSIKVRLQHSKNSKSFQIINSTININKGYEQLSIPPNSVSGISMDFKLSEYSDNLKYPFIIVEDDSEKVKLEIDKKVVCLWLAETPLLGQKNILFVKNIPAFLNTEAGFFGMLIGSSGTGKTRIINEITAIATSLNYKKILFDADVLSHLSAESFFKEIIAEIENIPDLSHITNKEIKKKYIAENKNSDYINFALKVLFSNGLHYNELKEELVDYLLYSLSKGKYYIALDNIQFYDENILTVFQALIQHHDKLTSSFILFSANTDYIYENTLTDKISHQMELKASKLPHQFIFKKMKSFSTTDAFDYLQKCLNGDNDSGKELFEYEKTIKKIIEVYGTNPLFLQNYLIYLYQESIIKQTDHSAYYIEDIDGLQESFTKIPHKIENLLELREERFVKDVIREDEMLEKYITFVCYLAFAKWMPYHMIKLLVDIPISILDSMERIALIKKNNKNEYGFYHQQIEEYYKCKYPYNLMTSESLKKFCVVARNQINQKPYLECIFLAQYILNEIDDEIWNEIILKICTDNIDYQKTYNVCEAISNILDNYSSSKLHSSYIEIYTHMTNLLTDRMGISHAQKLFKPIYDRFCIMPTAFISNLSDLTDMMKSYIINGLHLNQAQDSLSICNNVISLLQKHYSNCEIINTLLLELYESQIFIFNELQNLNMALSISNTVIDLSKKSNNVSKQVSAWYIRGDIYYSDIYSYKYIKEICECWNKAFKIYTDNGIKDEHEYPSTALYLNVYMREVLVSILQKDYEKAEKHMLTLKQYIGKTNMVFFEIKLRHLYVCFNVFTHSQLKLLEEYDELDLYIKESIDICAVYGSRALYLDCFHLLAILQRVCAKTDYAIDNYQKSYSIFRLMIEKQGNAIHWAYFILDLVIAMRQLNCKDKIPPHIWKFIDSYPDVKDIIKKTCDISQNKLSDFLLNLQYMGPLYYCEKYISFPRI